MNNSYTIKDLIQLFLNKIWRIVIVTAVGAVVGFCISEFLLPVKYASHINFYVQSYTDIKDDDDQNDIFKSKQLIGTYMTLLGEDDYVMQQISDDLMKKFDENTLKNCFAMDENGIKASAIRDSLSLTSVTDTSVITAVATTKNLEVSSAILQSLKDHANEDVQHSVNVGSISAISAPIPSNNSQPVSPNTMKNILLGAAAGFMLIILFVLMMDFFDNTVKDAEDLSKKYQKPILGEIQGYAHTEKKKEKQDAHMERLTLLDEKVPFYVKESYKSMRTNISFALSTYEKKIIAVTSANPGEGKSTTAINLAIALAEGILTDDEKKVILIDCDLRKPVIHTVMHLKNEVGVSTVLGKMNTVDKVIQHTKNKNLDVITAGKIPPNPSELLSSEQMKSMLEFLSQKYSVIVIDAPPLYVADVLCLSDQVAGMLGVIRYGSTTFNDVDNLIERAKLSNMHVIGLVLNDIRGGKHGGYYRYGKYGKYGRYAKYEYGGGTGYIP